MNIYDVLHTLLDRVPIHDATQAELLHDAVTAQAEGFKSAEEYRKDRAAKAPSANPAEDDAVLARAAEIQARRDAQQAGVAEQQAAVAEREAAARPAAPVAAGQPSNIASNVEAQPAPPTPAVVAGTPASPTAEPDASPPF
jgi:hypothetical protein